MSMDNVARIKFQINRQSGQQLLHRTFALSWAEANEELNAAVDSADVLAGAMVVMFCVEYRDRSTVEGEFLLSHPLDEALHFEDRVAQAVTFNPPA